MSKAKGFYTDDQKTVHPITQRHPHISTLQRGTASLGIPKRTAQQIHASRSQKARFLDERLKASLAKSEEEWTKNPNRLDLKGVDYPEPKVSTEKEIKVLSEHDLPNIVRCEKATVFKRVDESHTPTRLNSGSVYIANGEKHMAKLKDEKTGVEFDAEIHAEQVVNEFGDKMPEVRNLKVGDEIFNVGDIINVAPDPESFFGSEDQYKIERINQAANGRVVIVGQTARGASDVFYSEKWKRISKQKFSR